MIRLSSALFFFSQRITIDGCLVCNSAGDWVPETRFLGFGSVQGFKFCIFVIFESGSRLYETLKNHLIWQKFGLKMKKHLVQLELNQNQNFYYDFATELFAIVSGAVGE